MMSASPALRVALYLRVSTQGQTTDNQEVELRRVAQLRGWTIVSTFIDKGISGAKGRDKRPAFDSVLKGATRRDFDMVAAWSVDRLGRSISDLIATLQELNGAGCALYLHQQALDTTSPSGRAMFQMLGVFAEFEREMIRARVNAGLARARAQGKRLGRRESPALIAQRARVRAMLADGETVSAISAATGVSRASIYRERDALMASEFLA